MGRLVQPDEFIAENIDRYNERAVSNYSTLLESTPVFGTYYHQNRVFTTHDLGLENVEDDLGRDSPIKYEKIEKFPFYGMETFSLQIERGDIGLNSNIESDLLILPNTIKPYPNDYFYLDSLGDRYLFKVVEFQEDMIRSKPYYRVSFRLSKVQDETSSKEIEEQVIEEYTTVMENIGTDNECIIKTSTFTAIDKINKITDKLIKFYIRNFYDELNNVIIYKVNTIDITLYNRYLNKFLIDHNVFSPSSFRKEFYSSIKLLEYIPTEPEFDAAYEKTIYGALEMQSTKEFCSRFFTYMDINYTHAPWFRSNLDYKDTLMLNDDEEYAAKSDKIMEYIDKEFYGRIKINLPYDNEDDWYMENLIIRYINAGKKQIDIPDDKILDLINENIYRKDMRSYIFIPILIFILRQSIRHETINQL